MNDEQIEYRRAYTVGEAIYYQHCRNCHGDKGEGLSALMPPLTDKEFLAKNQKQLACIIKNGANQLLIINKKPYQNQMPPSGLAPIEIAQVLTYINNNFGNDKGLVTVTTVESQLKNCN
ncbi:c-type cytochrome [Mucilaginibacter ginkgonis]|uniref:Cytochrome c n=1 Tax=Mucilaginibacter ginkgonis TaxID=2682091 RepID=A0A7T7FCW8_9SPHI|nr:cytochrome c [Mucilaginibacter ginkgonis]QQL50803.1 cytochrome c [Mucilaginibacter ginkgonis]